MPLAAVAAVVAWSSPLAAQTFTWSNGANTGAWATGSNWVGNSTPTFGNTTDIVFQQSSISNDSQISFLGANRTIRALSFGANLVGASNTYDVRTSVNNNSTAANLVFSAASGNASITVDQSTSGVPQIRIGNNLGGTVLNSNLDLAQNNTFLTAGPGFQFNNAVSGTGTINKTGAGRVTLVRGNSSWSGGMNINEGDVTIFNDPNVMGTGTWTLGGGANNTSFSVGSTVTYNNAGGFVVAAGAGTRTILNSSTSVATGNPTLSGSVTLNKDAIFAVTQYTATTHDRLTLSNAISGTGGIVKTGSGILLLTGSGNNYSGPTDIQGGKLYLGGNGRLGSGNVTIASGANLDFGTGASGTNVVANNISGDGLIIQSTASTDTRFTGSVTSTGGMQIENGTVRIGNGGTTGSYSANTTVSAGASLAFARSDDYTHGGTISGAGGVSKTSAGTVTLTGSNDYSGNTALFTGALVAANANAFGTGNITFNAAGGGGTLRYTAASAGTDWATRIVNSSAAIRLDTAGNNVNLAGAIASSNTNGLVKSGLGVLTLAGSNSFSGVTTISAGTLSLGSGGAAGSVAGNIVNDAALLFNRSDAVTVANLISGNGTVTKLGAGTVTLTGNNSYAGVTAVDVGGMLVNGSHAGTGAVNVASAAWFGGDGSLGGDLVLASGAFFVFDPATTLDVAGAVTLDNSFAVASLRNGDGSAINWGSISDGTYTLINTTSTFNNIANFGAGNAENIGGGRSAYFQNGSLQLVIVPEPSGLGILGGAAAAGFVLRRRRGTRMAG